jgi:hypothetical protein
MAKLSENAVETIKVLNEQLFDAEYELERQKRAVSKYRYYLAANPSADTVMDLRGSMANLKACEKKVADIRRSLDKALESIWTL